MRGTMESPSWILPQKVFSSLGPPCLVNCLLVSLSVVAQEIEAVQMVLLTVYIVMLRSYYNGKIAKKYIRYICER